MKDLLDLDSFRDPHWELRCWGQLGNGVAGCFKLPSPEDQKPLRIMASRLLYGWDHVSVSRQDRVPSWGEMEHVKRTFFHDDETAMKLHVPPGEHVNNHENCLHIWRPCTGVIPRPIHFMVGIKGLDPEDARRLADPRGDFAA